jgi:hypothetical protein
MSEGWVNETTATRRLNTMRELAEKTEENARLRLQVEQLSQRRRSADKGIWGAIDKAHKVATILALLGVSIGIKPILRVLGIATHEEAVQLDSEMHSIAEMIRPGSSSEIHERALKVRVQ